VEEEGGGGVEDGVDLENSSPEAATGLEIKKQRNCLVRIVTGTI
jgi:hypothetical protein